MKRVQGQVSMTQSENRQKRQESRLKGEEYSSIQVLRQQTPPALRPFPAVDVHLHTLRLSFSACWVERMGWSKPPCLHAPELKNIWHLAQQSAVGPACKDIQSVLLAYV